MPSLAYYLIAWIRGEDPLRADRVRVMAEVWRWDYQQADDRELFDRDPEKARFKDAEMLIKSDPTAGFKQYHELAEEGSVWSMVQVSDLYRTGTGVGPSGELAEYWCRRAYEGGSKWALLAYGNILGTRGELAKCEEIFGPSAAAGWAPAMYWLAHYRLRIDPSRQTLREVRPLLERAAESGSPLALKFLSRTLLMGRYGIGEIPRGVRMAFQSIRQLNAIGGRVLDVRSLPTE